MTDEVEAIELARSVHTTLFRVMVDVRRHYLKSSTLTLTQMSLLGLLAERGPMRPAELSAIEAVQQPTMNTRIDRLAELGFVKRRHPTAATRPVYISITAHGTRVHRAAVNDVLGEMMSSMSTAELRSLQAALQPFDRFPPDRRTAK